MIKKILTAGFVILFSVFAIGLTMPTDASAADCGEGADSTFLNFPTWHRGLQCDGDGNLAIPRGSNPATVVFTVALNIIDIVMRLVAILATGFVMFGGFTLITAQGSPDKVKSGRTMIMRALVGMVIAVLASFVVYTIVGAMGNQNATASDLVHAGLNLFYFAAGAVAVIIIILAGYNYAMAAGDTNKTKKSMQTILYTAIGLAVVLLAFVITNFVLGQV